MKYRFRIFCALAVLISLLPSQSVFPTPTPPDNQHISNYFTQVYHLLSTCGEATGSFASELQIYRDARRTISPGKAYPRLSISGNMQSAIHNFSITPPPPLSNSIDQQTFSELLSIYEQVMRDCIDTQSWLHHYTQRYMYGLRRADSALAILDQQLRYLHMIHGELHDALQAAYFLAIEATLLQSSAHASLIQMKSELQLTHELIRTLDRLQLGATGSAVRTLDELKVAIGKRLANAPDLALNPVFMSYDHILREAFLPMAETLIINCEAQDYEYFNQYYRFDMVQIKEAYHALTDQFAYETLAWTPYEQEPDEILDRYFAEGAYPTAPPSTLRQIPLTNDASSEAR